MLHIVLKKVAGLTAAQQRVIDEEGHKRSSLKELPAETELYPRRVMKNLENGVRVVAHGAGIPAIFRRLRGKDSLG